MVDRVAEQAITNGFSTISIMPSVHMPGRGSKGACGSGFTSPQSQSRQCSPSMPLSPMPYVLDSGFIPSIREMLAPLRKIMEGMSLLREKTPQGLDYALSFVRHAFEPNHAPFNSHTVCFFIIMIVSIPRCVLFIQNS